MTILKPNEDINIYSFESYLLFITCWRENPKLPTISKILVPQQWLHKFHSMIHPKSKKKIPIANHQWPFARAQHPTVLARDTPVSRLLAVHFHSRQGPGFTTRQGVWPYSTLYSENRLFIVRIRPWMRRSGKGTESLERACRDDFPREKLGALGKMTIVRLRILLGWFFCGIRSGWWIWVMAKNVYE